MSIPADLAPDELSLERALELLVTPPSDRELGIDPATGLTVSVRVGRFGPYVQLGGSEIKGAKPPRASLFKSMTPDTLTLAEALELLHLPRVVGVDPATDDEIVARNGRYGPYLQRGKESRSLGSEEQLLAIDLAGALELFSRPKERRFGQTGGSPGRELGPDPESGSTILLRAGRFGPYVTEGTVNASLRRGDDPDSLTLERAAELLAERRAAGPRTPRAGREGGGEEDGGEEDGGEEDGGEEVRRQAGDESRSGHECTQEGHAPDPPGLNGLSVAANSPCRSVGTDGSAREVHRSRGR